MEWFAVAELLAEKASMQSLRNVTPTSRRLSRTASVTCGYLHGSDIGVLFGHRQRFQYFWRHCLHYGKQQQRLSMRQYQAVEVLASSIANGEPFRKPHLKVRPQSRLQDQQINLTHPEKRNCWSCFCCGKQQICPASLQLETHEVTPITQEYEPAVFAALLQRSI